MKIKNIILILLVIIWSTVIFYASSKTNIESNTKSKEIIYITVKQVIKITNKTHLTNYDVNNTKLLNQVVNDLNYPLRKCVHAFIYFILGILIIICFISLNKTTKKYLLIGVFLCFIYSLTDEYHQTLVNGRTGQFSDCLIDTFGGIIGCVLTFIIYNKRRLKRESK